MSLTPVGWKTYTPPSSRAVSSVRNSKALKDTLQTAHLPIESLSPPSDQQGRLCCSRSAVSNRFGPQR